MTLPDKSAQQKAAGVRTDEFSLLSKHAKSVPAECALRLQLGWDNGNNFLSYLDNESWEALAKLPPNQGLQLINSMEGSLTGSSSIHNLSAVFTTQAKDLLGKGSSTPTPGVVPERRAGASRVVVGIAGFDKLSRAVQEKVKDLLMAQGTLFKPSHFDKSIIETLCKLPETRALQKLTSVEGSVNRKPPNVKNIPGYMQNTLNKEF